MTSPAEHEAGLLGFSRLQLPRPRGELGRRGCRYSLTSCGLEKSLAEAAVLRLYTST